MSATAWTPGRIRELRRARQLTQDELGRELGVRVETVNRWERGKQQPRGLAVRRLEELAQEAQP